MGFLLNKITISIIIFLSMSFIVIGFTLQAVLIPIQDIHLLSNKDLLEFQKEYAINYPLGIGLLYFGLLLMILVIILFMIKFIQSKNESPIGKID